MRNDAIASGMSSKTSCSISGGFCVDCFGLRDWKGITFVIWFAFPLFGRGLKFDVPVLKRPGIDGPHVPLGISAIGHSRRATGTHLL